MRQDGKDVPLNLNFLRNNALPTQIRVVDAIHLDAAWGEGWAVVLDYDAVEKILFMDADLETANSIGHILSHKLHVPVRYGTET